MKLVCYVQSLVLGPARSLDVIKDSALQKAFRRRNLQKSERDLANLETSNFASSAALAHPAGS